jgi:hypothetical protein
MEEHMEKPVAIALAALVATASPAPAQQRVYTNVVDGRPQREIVTVLREVRPAAPVPPSITTTPTPVGWTPERGGSSYVPPARAPVAPARPAPAPWFINGIYAGPSPNGRWLATSIGRQTIDVNIVGRSGRR